MEAAAHRRKCMANRPNDPSCGLGSSAAEFGGAGSVRSPQAVASVPEVLADKVHAAIKVHLLKVPVVAVAETPTPVAVADSGPSDSPCNLGDALDDFARNLQSTLGSPTQRPEYSFIFRIGFDTGLGRSIDALLHALSNDWIWLSISKVIQN